MTTILDTTTATPSAEHVKVYRQQAGMMANEDIHAAISDYEYIRELADVDHRYSPEINAHSRLNALAAIAGYRAELTWRASKGISKPLSSLGWPRELLDNLKGSVRIESEIARAVTLRRRGSSLSGLCPFHDDHNPSLVVWPDSGRWRCFGCGVHGDVLTWLQAYNRLTFSESVHYLAAMAGVDMPRKSTRQPVTIRERGRA